MDTSTDVEHYIQLEMPMDHIMMHLVEAQPEPWKREHLVCRDDQQHGSVMGFTAPALDMLVQDVATYTGFGSEEERDFYAASLRWRKTPVQPTASSTSGETSHEPCTHDTDP
jgi:hypothetical protein